MTFLWFFSSESSQPVGSLGHDADLRQQQQDTRNCGTDVHRLFTWLSETLANARHSDASLTDTVNKALGLSTDVSYEEPRQKPEYEVNTTPDKKEHEQLPCPKMENTHFKGTRSSVLEVDTASLKYPRAAVCSSEDTEHKLRVKEVSFCLLLFFLLSNVCEREDVGVVFLFQKQTKLELKMSA